MIAPSLSQTPDDLKKRYGAPDERGCYKVRPGIILAVSGQENEQGYTLSVEPEEISDSEVISLTIAGQIIEELMPAPRRGKFIMALTIRPPTHTFMKKLLFTLIKSVRQVKSVKLPP